MFYRRKVILALIQLLGNEIEATRLQKLIFLFTQRQKKSEYDFIPYKFGCYSFSLGADISAMVRHDQIKDEDGKITKCLSDDFLSKLTKIDKEIILDVVKVYGNMSVNSLIRHTYINFPYYAINSTIAKEILSENQYNRVLKSKKRDNQIVLFTIGYEGISLEAYLNKLIKNNITLLVDVRRNSTSMKYGFSKSSLERYCNKVGINFLHIPEVGIESEQRQELKTQKDYDLLFEKYKRNTLNNTTSFQESILQLLLTNKRIALTCFEANICQCHRKPLAESIAKFDIFEGNVQHI